MSRFRLVWGLFVFVVTFVVFLVLLIVQHGPQPKAPLSQMPIESVVAAEVAERYEIPVEPPIVTHLDGVEILSLTNPAFYSSLQNGDWLVRYPHLLIVYRREEGRIIKVETLE
jgi:hypothetical protein